MCGCGKDDFTFQGLTPLLYEETGETLLRVFIPTVPNPTSGFLVMLKESQTKNPYWSVDEAMKLVISGGIIGPEIISSLTKDAGK